MNFTIETELEEDGRWIAEVLEIPGTLAYGDTKQEAISKVQALGLRVIADRHSSQDGPVAHSVAGDGEQDQEAGGEQSTVGRKGQSK